MDYAVLKKIAEYSDVYEVAALGISSVEEMKAALKKKGATSGTFQRRTEYLTGQPTYISINGDELSYDYQTLAEELHTLTENLIPKGYGQDSEQELEEEIKMLKRQIADLTSELQEYRERCRVVRSLINDGFSNIHVRFLKPLVIAGYNFEEIKELFNQHSDTEEIRDFIKQMGIV